MKYQPYYLSNLLLLPSIRRGTSPDQSARYAPAFACRTELEWSDRIEREPENQREPLIRAARPGTDDRRRTWCVWCTTTTTIVTCEEATQNYAAGNLIMHSADLWSMIYDLCSLSRDNGLCGCFGPWAKNQFVIRATVSPFRTLSCRPIGVESE